MAYPGFVPFTGFDPLDGADDRFVLSRDNLRHLHPTHNPARQDGEGDSGRGVYVHGELS